jgi:hypothetical protein
MVVQKCLFLWMEGSRDTKMKWMRMSYGERAVCTSVRKIVRGAKYVLGVGRLVGRVGRESGVGGRDWGK